MRNPQLKKNAPPDWLVSKSFGHSLDSFLVCEDYPTVGDVTVVQVVLSSTRKQTEEIIEVKPLSIMSPMIPL